MAYPALAKAMKLIAREGRDAFYTGEIAEDIIATVRPKGSLLTMDDLAAHESNWVKPISTEFAGHRDFRDPAIRTGPHRADRAQHSLAVRHQAPCADSAERHHLEIEAMKLAWELRNRHIADPDFAEVPVDELLSAKTAAQTRRHDRHEQGARHRCRMRQSDTIYLSVVDEKRLAVSFINSVYDGFGSCIVTPKTGIALQNRGACFVTDPKHPNCIGPGKRPLHTIIPAMVKKNGKIDMSYGVMGGDYQPMGHMTVAVNRYIYGMDPQEAIDWPRYFPKARQGAGGKRRAGGGAARPRRARPCAGKYPQNLGGGQAIAIDRRTACSSAAPTRARTGSRWVIEAFRPLTIDFLIFLE
jgi:gamma-glutamyltranspeptidase / glutathione hydrolase